MERCKSDDAVTSNDGLSTSCRRTARSECEGGNQEEEKFCLFHFVFFFSCCEGLSQLVIVVQVVGIPDKVFGTAFGTFACGQAASQNLADG